LLVVLALKNWLALKKAGCDAPEPAETTSMSRQSACYAIIPAAGRSERMGRSKLLLSWRGVGDAISTLLDHVLQAWTSSRVSRTVIVIRTDAEPAIKTICQSHGVDVVLADDPIDMKASCLHGLEHLSRRYSPSPEDRFFVCPSDIPGITTGLIDHLLREAERDDGGGQAGEHVIVPTYQGRRGHPVLFPWSMAGRLSLLRSDQGVNALVDSAAVLEVAISESPEKMGDIDTLEEYAAAARLFAENNRVMPPHSSNSDLSSRSERAFE
jgi:molybdenum cofactor cytidylyltransferase